ncbi:MarR family transcriptional regulator [Flammeovirga sp. EKP202]|uniref:MarR family transcriptional regulator n=1 Tax=Flammeovirga sp. EKP202 TaxID=2770592 RepID=UPI00165F668C|nr:MarR family transcriptional regulator [Flammeovirga sp. EKP202]MBD0404317.1 MarR family transcriptional regulator [Flammeovirga sp. EKP202]
MDKKVALEQFVAAHKFDGLPPLAVRIIGVFYISNEKYLTFDDIIELADSSKGAVSKMLKVLIAVRRVNFIQDPASSRKRLFYLDAHGVEEYIKLVVNGLMDQNTQIRRLSEFRTSESDKEIDELIDKTIQFNSDVITSLLKLNVKHYKKK